jgi:hypothetical protein
MSIQNKGDEVATVTPQSQLLLPSCCLSRSPAIQHRLSDLCHSNPTPITPQDKRRRISGSRLPFVPRVRTYLSLLAFHQIVEATHLQNLSRKSSHATVRGKTTAQNIAISPDSFVSRASTAVSNYYYEFVR